MDITQNVLGATAQNLGIDKTIGKMNELEKRMLIILTLVQQMRNSGAMNDFARTVEQPANQLRILVEQTKEVGRWLGSVFYGVLGNILPYLNGFVMALKEVVKAFALFVGFELPNSSGQTGTILDSYGDSMGDLNSGISDTNSGLDSAKKKAKELKKSLAGFDKLNIISKPSDDSDKDANSGGMSIDPKILEALNNYKYLFDDIHMKATDIKDQLLEWSSIAKKSLDENIFRPMKISWDKYGGSITENMKSTFSDITDIASGIFDVVVDKWKPFFQSASDLFFSLLDTVSLVSSSITSFFKSVWDNGGNVFLEGVFDLITATMKLAKAINDDFIKPTIGLFKDTFGVVVSTALGGVLKLIGLFMTELSKFISLISKSSPIVKGLGVTLAGVFTVIQIGKLTQLWNSFGQGYTTTQKLVNILYDKSKIFRTLTDNYLTSKLGFSNLKNMWQSGLGTISNMLTRLRDKVDMMIFDKTATEGATAATSGLTIAQKLCAAATTSLQTALTFLSNHPLVAIAIALATAITAFALLGSKSSETTKKIEDCSQEIQDQAQEIKDYSSAVESSIKSAEEQVSSTEAQISMTEKYIDKLKKLEDENGYVDNIEQAKFFIDEINKVLPNTFEITEDGRVIQKKTNDDLSKSIDLTREQAKARAYQEAYVETLKNQLLTEQKLNEQKVEYTRLLDEAKQQYQEYLKTAGSYNDSQKLTLDQWLEGNEALEEQKSLMQTTTTELDKQSSSVEYLETKMEDLTETLGTTSNKMDKLSETTQKAFDNIGKSGQNNMKDVIKSLDNYGSKLKESSENTSKYTSKEIADIQKNRDNKVIEYGKMVRDYDFTYNQIIEIAKQSGINFTLAEQGTLASIVEMYKTSGIQSGDNYVNNLSTKISDGSWKISNSAKNNILDTNEILKNIPIEYRTQVEEALSKAERSRQDAQNNVGNINIGVTTTINWKKLNEDIKEMNRKFANSLPYNALLSEKGKNDQYNDQGGWLKYKAKAYATGGFPDVGQMFIAREKGPELVGSMGGRTTVANNQQIETGIEEASYRGMARALQDTSGSKGDTYIEVVTVVDGEVIDRRIEKANDKHILKTGKPLFSK
ncbi:MAG: hypothetical protein RR585_01455 [Coprobacillus sp.]